MRCEDCLSRRQFIAVAAGGAATAALPGCGDGDISGAAEEGGTKPPPTPPAPVSIVVGNFPELANNGVFVKVPSSPYAVKRTGASTFAAFDIRCTHQGCATQIVSGIEFHCFCHDSHFDNDGAVTNGPAVTPLRTVATSYNAGTDTLTFG